MLSNAALQLIALAQARRWSEERGVDLISDVLPFGRSVLHKIALECELIAGRLTQTPALPSTIPARFTLPVRCDRISGMAIHFDCPWCIQTISVDDSKAHERVECPYCGRPVKVPTKSTRDPPPLEKRPSGTESQRPQPAEPSQSATAMKGAMRQIVEFIFPKRIHRLSFLVRSLAVNLCLWLILASSFSLAPVIADTADWMRHYPYSNVAILALALYQLLFVLAPRARDTGISGWWILLSLFPVVNGFFYLFLIFRAPEYHFEGSSTAAEQT